MSCQVGWPGDVQPRAHRGCAPVPSDGWRATLDDAVETRLFGTLVRRAVRRLGARHVLDVGCGVGTPTLEAARAGAERVIGVDPILHNVERARANILRSGLDRCVRAHHASWRDVVSGRLPVGHVDLVVSNPPYVPGGRGSAVDGGPRGTKVLDAIVDGVSRSVRGLALLLGSLSDPLQVIARLHARGFAMHEMLVEPVPFGRYTSEPGTLATLQRLRDEGCAWFCDAAPDGDGAPHQYLTIGIVARRDDAAASAAGAGAWLERAAALLDAYQRTGVVVLDGRPGLRSFEHPDRRGLMLQSRPGGRGAASRTVPADDRALAS